MPFQSFLRADFPTPQVDAVEVGDEPFVYIVQNQSFTVYRRDSWASGRAAWYLTLEDQITNGEHQLIITVILKRLLPVDQIGRDLNEVYAIEIA